MNPEDEALMAFASLTEKQRQVAGLIVAGDGHKEIALKLDVSQAVISHRKRGIRDGFGIQNDAQLCKLWWGQPSENALKEAGVPEEEHDIVRMFLDEKTDEEISQELYIAEGSIQRYRNKTYKKLDAHNLAGLWVALRTFDNAKTFSRIKVENDACQSSYDEALGIFESLSKKKQQIALLLIAGNPVKRIAENLGNTRRTISTHKEKIFKAFNVHSIGDLCARLKPFPRMKTENDGVHRRLSLDSETLRILGSLSERKQQVALLLAAGYRAEEVAEELQVARKTISFHNEEIFKAFNVHSVEGLRARLGTGNLPDVATLRASKFTRRQCEIIKFLWEGMTIRGIAHEMNIAEKTVQFHMCKIYKKLGISSNSYFRKALLSMVEEKSMDEPITESMQLVTC